MYNYDEYMRAIIGERPIQINRYPIQTNVYNTYNRQNINIPEPSLDTINLYPEIFIKINPLILNRCKEISSKPTQETISQLVEEIYMKIENNGNNNYLKDLIRILILNQIFSNNKNINQNRETFDSMARFRQTNNRKYLEF